MYDVKKVEKEAQEFWKKIDLLKKINEKNKDSEKYFLLDGPPYANYVPHAGHMKTTVVKDLYIRLAMMEGKDVLFQPGFDTHGLPIENMVEKKLKLKSKQDIEKLGIKKFVKECRASAAENKDLWLEYYEMLGSWYSWKTPYLTYDNSYLESAWWAFSQQWEKGMIYEGKKPVHWCPHCQTSLAGYEVTDSYKMVTDPGVYVKFKLKDRDASLLVFTTTPWTLPSNVAISIAPDKDYVEVETEKGNIILAEKRLELLEKIELEYKVKKKFKGKDIVGKEYESLLDVPVQKELQKNPKALKIYASIPILKERVASKVSAKKGLKKKDVYEDFVTVEEGTGLVHTAPGHGKTDNEVGQHYGLPDPSPLDDACKFTDDAGMWQGEFVKDADHAIADHMHKTGKLLHFENITHNYPLCWRCKSPLIFRLSNQWFLKIDGIKDKMLEENEDVNWQPEFARERFRNWVANAEDWNFSRQRYWGIPIPVWKCDECAELKVIKSLKELQKESEEKIPDDFDLHASSEIKIKCKCKGTMVRVPHIFDVWYDSGCAPFASLGYPHNNKKLLESHYPVDRISESQDQIRGWFYSLMFVNVSVFDKAPYKTVSMPGWVLDEKGDKMSKSVGNMVYAKKALGEHGADAVRFYYCWESAPYGTTKFNMGTIRSEVSKFFNIYWNLHNYLLSQKVKPGDADPKEIEDEWILSRLNTVLRNALHAFNSFELHQGGREIYEFVIEDLSRSYVQMIRDRIEDDDTPINVINHCLLQMTRLLASVSPHVTERVYQEMKQINDDLEESVHLDKVPEAGESNPELEGMMIIVQDIIATGLACRDRAQVGVRWPLEELIVDTDNKEVEKALKKLSAIIQRQCNVKKVVIREMNPKLTVKPDFRQIGTDFGSETSEVATALKKESDDIAKKLSQGKKEFKVGKFKLQEKHLQVEKEAPEGYEASEFKQGTVYLDTKASKELEEEGFAREVTRRVQQLRKEAGLEKDDRIELVIESDMDFLENFSDDIKDKVGADSLEIVEKAKGKFKYSKEDEVKKKKFKVLF